MDRLLIKLKGTLPENNMTKPINRRSRHGSESAACRILTVIFGSYALATSAATLLVWPESPSPAPPYASWASAARNIQDAIDAASPSDDIVVTNGVYATGGRGELAVSATSNRVSVTKPVTVRSLNGPGVTIIQGARGVRCAYLTDDALLSGFTLTNAIIFEDGGAGVFCHSMSAVVSNCIIVGNSTGGSGGGAWGGSLHKCLVANNAASDDGGGAIYSTLNHCTLSDNYANDGGGGAYGSSLNDCALTGNWAPDDGGGGAYSCTLNRCTLTGNSAGDSGGGGAHSSTLSDCILSRNSAGAGGGAVSSALNNCLLLGNVAHYGGGAFDCTLTNCTLQTNVAWIEQGGAGGGSGGGANSGSLSGCVLVNNTASFSGGGTSFSMLNCCILQGNSAPLGGGCEGDGSTPVTNSLLLSNRAEFSGGGVYGCDLANCTLAGNTAEFGGGVAHSRLVNSIVYYNSSPNGENYFQSDFGSSCSMPDAGSWAGNITNEPAFQNAAAGDYRLSPGSACIDAGADLSDRLSADLNGVPRPMDGNRDGLARFDMGAYEFNPLFFTSIERVGNNMRLTWFDTLAGMKLQTAAAPPSALWSDVALPPGTNSVEIPFSSSNSFFRLLLPP